MPNTITSPTRTRSTSIEMQDVTGKVALAEQRHSDLMSVVGAPADIIGKNFDDFFADLKKHYGITTPWASRVSQPGPPGSSQPARGMPIRSWLKDFSMLQKPQGPNYLNTQQLLANLDYFKGNYTAMTGAIVALGLFTNTYCLMTIIVIALAWMFFLPKNADPAWQTAVGGIEILPHHRIILMFLTTSSLLLYVAGLFMLCLIGFGVILSVAHASTNNFLEQASYSAISMEESNI